MVLGEIRRKKRRMQSNFGMGVCVYIYKKREIEREDRGGLEGRERLCMKGIVERGFGNRVMNPLFG